MPRLLLILTLLPACVPDAQAQAVRARIERIATPVATLEDVRVELARPAGAGHGRLRLQAGRVDAGELGYAYRDLAWECPLQRVRVDDADVRWLCDGEIRSGRGAPLRLAVDLGAATTDATLAGAGATLALHRDAATPDLTTLDLRRVPVQWAQALVAQAWTAAQLQRGSVDGRVRVEAPADRPLHVDARLALRGVALETDDGSVAADGVGGDFEIDLRLPAGATQARLDGQLQGGELLFGNAYIALPETPVAVGFDLARSDGQDWQLPRLHWRDGAALTVDGSARLSPEFDIRALALEVASTDAGALPARYLSGWLGLAGLSGLALRGGFDATLVLADGELDAVALRMHALDLEDSGGRFRFDALNGDIRYAAGAPVRSAFAWQGGTLYGLPFDAAAWSLQSGQGRLTLREPVALSLLDGEIGFESLVIEPPTGGTGLRVQTALRLDGLDIGVLAKSLDWPPFEGQLSGSIPAVRYADNRIDFDGGLSVQLFVGRIDVSQLSIERPFGVAPTVTSDLDLIGLDLHAMTNVFGFGSISGRLHGRIAGLRLVDWTATAFDAELHTEPVRGVRQRISQRAVQNISSVGDASFVTSLQGRLIGLFDDFGYRRIGVACRLRNEVCRMGGLRSAENTFTIVEGAGLPRLNVVGINRNVDWPTLVERLGAVAGGDVDPVFD
ncbi:AsmA-like C-terminal region-containing protein [Luteimonas sp. BDR2-5]|uniref:AsmA-like C-terminal region-containing protein n=1 Tax=Proluteimonas luteida TaxID=2878685 RepID=UPI001E48966F|nr:AsmA-like C-terminal region-containing protein [Luteimonas sp. BDR2-5]MCD9028447.1 AsmA-like C-terminal region-containing protein [Luteimonas sp. BDR2-5]